MLSSPIIVIFSTITYFQFLRVFTMFLESTFLSSSFLPSQCAFCIFYDVRLSETNFLSNHGGRCKNKKGPLDYIFDLSGVGRYSLFSSSNSHRIVIENKRGRSMFLSEFCLFKFVEILGIYISQMIK